MKRYLSLIFAFMFVALFALVIPAFAQSAPNPDLYFLSQVIDAVKTFGGLSWAMKISTIVLLAIGSMKVSFIQPLWAKLGAAQAFVAPLLGLVIGALSLSPFSWAGMLAYMGAGAGAIAIHELLDALKAFPGLGPMYVAVINWLESILGAPAPVVK